MQSLPVSFAKLFPDQIVLAVDAKRGRVLTDGWRKTSMFDVVEFVAAFGGVPLAAILFTDVGVEAEETDLGMSAVSSVAAATKTPVIASGLVRTIDDVSTLKYIGNIHGAVVGRALFNRSVELADALEVARPGPEVVAEFV